VEEEEEEEVVVQERETEPLPSSNCESSDHVKACESSDHVKASSHRTAYDLALTMWVLPPSEYKTPFCPPHMFPKRTIVYPWLRNHDAENKFCLLPIMYAFESMHLPDQTVGTSEKLPNLFTLVFFLPLKIICSRRLLRHPGKPRDQH
jgi:hypothetical protein